MRCREIARRILEINNAPSNTHGNLVYAKTGIYGAKGEALSGFNTAFKVGLPALRKALSEGYSGNDAMVITLLNLMTVSEDSNVVYRGGLEGLEFIKNESKLILNDFDIGAVREFDSECIKRNLSPGGSADLLAVTAMLHMIIK
jgi:triphosphoribosyl-dephospho-CoA synthase